MNLSEFILIIVRRLKNDKSSSSSNLYQDLLAGLSLIKDYNVKDNDPERSAIMANQIASAFEKYSRQITIDDSVQVIDVAEPDWNPVQPKPLIYMFLGAVIGVLLAY